MDRRNLPSWIAAAAALAAAGMTFFGGFATKDDLDAFRDEVRGDIREIRDELRELRGYFVNHLDRSAGRDEPAR